MTISMQLPKEAADLVMKAIDIALAVDSKDEQHSDKAEDSFFQKQADALVEVARGFLAGGAEKRSSTADHYNGKVIPESPMFQADYYDNPSRDGLVVDHEGEFVREPLRIYAVG